MRDNFNNQLKLDKEKQKKQKEDQAKRAYMIGKQQEKVQQVQLRKKHNDQELNHKIHETEKNLKEKMQASEINRKLKVEEFMKQRLLNDHSLNMDDRKDDEVSHSKKNILQMSKSQNIRSLHDETVKYQMHNIERKIHRANEKRLEKITNHVERQHGHQNKFEQTLLIKSELMEKQEYDIMNKVVLKHHNAA
jgi:hypothetical protein